jgi:hypothetical protein
MANSTNPRSFSAQSQTDDRVSKEIPRVSVHTPADERRMRIEQGIALIIEQDAELLAELARR